ncbi:MAG: substrate-binding domain-containing protein [Gemmataceae bacterium]|nr:substrate-binding domain-containing protein [Gemmataceae bacterium]
MPRVLLLCLLLGGCAPAEPPPRRLVVSAPRAFAPLLAAWEQADPAARADVETTISPRAVADVREGLADLALVGRDLRPDETGVVAHVLGRDAVAVIVHKDNPIPNLTTNQAAGLFARVHTDWKELGGTERPISTVGLGEGRAVRDAFLDYLGVKPPQTRPDPAVANSEQAVAAVASRPGAVGYVALASARAAMATAPVRVVPLDGVAPSPDTVLTGKYPLVRPVVLVSRPTPRPAVQAFLDFARSARGRAILAAQGYVPGGP